MKNIVILCCMFLFFGIFFQKSIAQTKKIDFYLLDSLVNNDKKDTLLHFVAEFEYIIYDEGKKLRITKILKQNIIRKYPNFNNLVHDSLSIDCYFRNNKDGGMLITRFFSKKGPQSQENMILTIDAYMWKKKPYFFMIRGSRPHVLIHKYEEDSFSENSFLIMRPKKLGRKLIEGEWFDTY